MKSMLDLDAIEKRAKAAQEEITGLADGSRKWRMCVPVQPTDSDQVLMSLADDVLALVSLARTLEVHEGGKPQVMTADILKRWIASIDVPIMTDIYQTNAPNVFYATFAQLLSPEHKLQMKALSIEAIYPNSPLRNRYMLVWSPPKDDEY